LRPWLAVVLALVGIVVQLGFEVGESAVLEAEGGPGRVEPFVQDAVVLGELMDAVFEGGVLGGDVFDRLAWVVLFQVADVAHERSDARALGVDLGVRGFEGVLGVEGVLAPRGFLSVGSALWWVVALVRSAAGKPMLQSRWK
jgi:hypothetical protein